MLRWRLNEQLPAPALVTTTLHQCYFNLPHRLTNFVKFTSFHKFSGCCGARRFPFLPRDATRSAVLPWQYTYLFTLWALCDWHNFFSGRIRRRIETHLYYTVSQKKEATNLWAVTLPNLNRFKKFFHWQTQQEICYAVLCKHSTTPNVCRYTTFRNMNYRKFN